jgi:hypothetical protein
MGIAGDSEFPRMCLIRLQIEAVDSSAKKKKKLSGLSSANPKFPQIPGNIRMK